MNISFEIMEPIVGVTGTAEIVEVAPTWTIVGPGMGGCCELWNMNNAGGAMCPICMWIFM